MLAETLKVWRAYAMPVVFTLTVETESSFSAEDTSMLFETQELARAKLMAALDMFLPANGLFFFSNSLSLSLSPSSF